VGTRAKKRTQRILAKKGQSLRKDEPVLSEQTQRTCQQWGKGKEGTSKETVKKPLKASALGKKSGKQFSRRGLEVETGLLRGGNEGFNPEEKKKKKRRSARRHKMKPAKRGRAVLPPLAVKGKIKGTMSTRT